MTILYWNMFLCVSDRLFLKELSKNGCWFVFYRGDHFRPTWYVLQFWCYGIALQLRRKLWKNFLLEYVSLWFNKLNLNKSSKLLVVRVLWDVLFSLYGFGVRL